MWFAAPLRDKQPIKSEAAAFHQSHTSEEGCTALECMTSIYEGMIAVTRKSRTA